ncbi:MAG: stage II sporulation protein M [Acidimicrobiia bacterium]|nr:stage II sporulation protein M [Acidimicrobiia bacterium]
MGRARRLVYDVRPRRASLWAFLTTGYWRRVRERPWPLAAAALMLFGPWVLAAVWAVGDPGAAVGVMPSEYRVVADPDHFEGGSDELDAEAQTAFSSLIFTNNIRVAFIVFVGGIAVGLGTVAMLVYQGVIFGAITGMAVWAGNGPPFFELVSPHGVLELSCIVVAGAAGLRLGWALVDPGHRRRGRLSWSRVAGRPRRCWARCRGSSWPASSRAS